MSASAVLALTQRLQALAQAGLTYAENAYDTERYAEIRSISAALMQELSGVPLEKITTLFASETGYQTPKVDVRAVMFRGENEVLLVQEKMDGNRWTLPGGWADIGLTPFEVAVKEAREESGLQVQATRLLALLDKRKHMHPLQYAYVYKCFVHCEVVGGDLSSETSETLGARWVRREEIAALDLSTDRVTASQLDTMFAFARNPDLPTLCD
jgi:ADP-ribose pyrophosphatase YjhB (NUDIX family)